jgi:hypothetical protein
MATITTFDITEQKQCKHLEALVAKTDFQIALNVSGTKVEFKHAKDFLQGPSAKISRELLELNRIQLKRMIGQLAEFVPFNGSF